jgi:cytochrome P450
MLASIGLSLLGVAFFALLWPVIDFLRDRRGLRKYPVQNLLSGVTTLAYNWEIGRRHKTLRTRRLYEAHQEKGPIIRVAPDWLSFGTAAAVKDIYGHKSPLLKNDVYFALQGEGQHLANMTDKAAHASRRHLVAASYAPKNVETWEPKIADLAGVLVANMDKLCTAPLPKGLLPAPRDLQFDGSLWGLLFGFEGVCQIGLSLKLGFIEQGSDVFTLRRPDGGSTKINAIETLHGYYGPVASLIWDTKTFSILKPLSGIFSKWYARGWQHGVEWRQFLTQLVLERQDRFDAGEQLDDLFQGMLEDRRTGERPDVNQTDRIAEMDQMFNGAVDGTGSSLVNTLYYIVKHPEAYKRVRAEIDEALGADDVIAPWDKVKNLPFLKACIDEAGRLAPGVAGDLPRRTPPGKDYMVAGVAVPGDTSVSISAYTAQRDPVIFPDPEAFKPERWLIKGDDHLKKMLDVYLVFTMGSRMCMGKSVTVLIQSVYLATLLHRYDFALANPDWVLEKVEFFNQWPKSMPMKIWRREWQTTNGVSV